MTALCDQRLSSSFFIISVVFIINLMLHALNMDCFIFMNTLLIQTHFGHKIKRFFSLCVMYALDSCSRRKTAKNRRVIWRWMNCSRQTIYPNTIIILRKLLESVEYFVWWKGTANVWFHTHKQYFDAIWMILVIFEIWVRASALLVAVVSSFSTCFKSTRQIKIEIRHNTKN